MNNHTFFNDYSLDNLMERAKELNCLYLVDEILSNQRLSLAEIFNQLIKAIPSGFQYPEICRVRIVYQNRSYQLPDFWTSPYLESCDIRMDDKLVGTIEVVYIEEIPKSEEGYFLEKEQKLIRAIADRIGQTLLQRHIKQVMQEWDSSRYIPGEKSGSNYEWFVIVDLLVKTDQDMLLNICRKMIHYLLKSGIKEAEEILWQFSSESKLLFDSELNYPLEKLPQADLIQISEKTFEVASRHLSPNEISMRLKRWIQEEKTISLIKSVDRIDASVSEIIEAITRYRNISAYSKSYYSPAEHWLTVALIRRFLSDKLEFISIARPHIEVNDFYDIVTHLIFPEGSHGKIGGKSTGLFLAQQILKKADAGSSGLYSVKVPKTWYITTDEIKEFLHYNNLEELNTQKYKELYEIRLDYPNVIQTMKNCRFPEGIIKSLSMALDDFGDTPLIVRSSSLLEDQEGAAFSGKYKSLFLANQGTKKERLEALMNAIVEVYASMYSPDSIQYRAERGMLDFPEEMGIMIQEVVGTKIGHYYFPLYSGVAFSNNEFRWSPRIKREDGLIRLVMGLGTRAVDRVSDDFPVLVSPGQPNLKVNIAPDEVKHYSQKKIDLINLKKNVFETVEIETLLKEFGEEIPKIHRIVSVYKQDYISKPLAFDIDFQKDELVVTFDGLISDTPFIKKVDHILKKLREELGTPVDIEFASDGEHFYLLQCRPQSYGAAHSPEPIPKDIESRDIIFSADKYISNGIISDISYIVYVDPEAYSQVQEFDDFINIGRAVGQLNSLLPKRRFILIGPGRWGSRGDVKLGVQVRYSDINNTAALIEVAHRKAGYVPELSFGTHFFQDLVEADIRYLPLYPDDDNVIFNERFLTGSENMLPKLLPQWDYLKDVVRVIDVMKASQGRVLKIVMNADLEEAIGYLESPSERSAESYEQIVKPEKIEKDKEFHYDDRYWRWRYHMAERIAANLEPKRFGVKGMYVFGSTNNGMAGPGSDIDLLVHFDGTERQKEELLQWLQGWSLCLAEMNYQKTGYLSDGLLDVHLITDEDIAKKTAFAAKIGAVTDPAQPLKLKDTEER